MKNKTLLSLAIIAAISLIGCSTVGPNPTPPTALERNIFIVQTNYVEQVNSVTNVITEVINRTNEFAQPVFFTNIITQVAQETNIVPAYTLTPSDTSKATAGVVGSVINAIFPGAGTATTYGLLGLLAAWGHLRSNKRGTTNEVIAQEVETLREVIKTLPNGVRYDTAITAWLQSHQVQEGVATQVLGLVRDSIDNPAAKVAAQEIMDTIKATTPPAL